MNLRTVIMTSVLALPMLSMKVMAMPDAPSGKVWQTVPELTDDLSKFDANKWPQKHPYWSGRSPRKFNSENISFEDAKMPTDPSDGDSTVKQVPSKIQAEGYNRFNDVTPGNQGRGYRNGDVERRRGHSTNRRSGWWV